MTANPISITDNQDMQMNAGMAKEVTRTRLVSGIDSAYGGSGLCLGLLER